METKDKERKRYQKPEVRRVELSLAEAVLGTGCNTTGADQMQPDCTMLECMEPT
jgi:hypothetical protein